MKKILAAVGLLLSVGAQAEVIAFGTWRELAVQKNKISYSYLFGVVDSSQWREHCMPPEDRTQAIILLVLQKTRNTNAAQNAAPAHRVINNVLHERYPCA